MLSIAVLKGVIHGKTIELDERPELPDGERVNVQVEPVAPPKYLDRFDVNPSIALGKLLVRGTRLRVGDLVELVEQGRSDEELRGLHPELTEEDVNAVRQYSKVPEGLRKSFGGWAEDAEELDKYLEWTRQNRKLSRPEIEE
jgi:uncharacterized protein (DUF433 family)